MKLLRLTLLALLSGFATLTFRLGIETTQELGASIRHTADQRRLKLPHAEKLRDAADELPSEPPTSKPVESPRQVAHQAAAARELTSALQDKVSKRQDVVLTCMYASPGFYVAKGRSGGGKALNWALVFIMSLFRHRMAGNGVSTRLVVFADAGTAEKVRQMIAERAEYHTALLGGKGSGGKRKKKGRVDVLQTASEIREFERFVEIIPLDWEERFPGMRWANLTLIRNAANNFRFSLFRDYLRGAARRTNRVLFSDFTDVGFQANPFDGCVIPSEPANPVVRFTLEFPRWTFTNEVYNRRWMGCYPKGVLPRLRYKPVSCAGVTLGTVSGMLRYTELMLVEIAKEYLVDCSITGVRAALDQANHNYVLHMRPNRRMYSEPIGIDVRPAPYAEACTYHGNWVNPRYTQSGAAANTSRTPYAIVHQYTSCRRPALMGKFHADYIPDMPYEACRGAKRRRRRRSGSSDKSGTKGASKGETAVVGWRRSGVEASAHHR